MSDSPDTYRRQGAKIKGNSTIHVGSFSTTMLMTMLTTAVIMMFMLIVVSTLLLH